MKKIIPICILSIFCNCTIYLPLLKESKEQYTEIFSVVYQNQILKEGDGFIDSVSNVYLAFKKGDPQDIVFNKIKENNPNRTIRKYSECYKTNDSRYCVFDKQSNQRGIIFFIDDYCWMNRNNIICKGGYYLGHLTAIYCKYYLIKEDGKWIFKKRQPYAAR